MIGAYELQHCIDMPYKRGDQRGVELAKSSAAPTATSTSTACSTRPAADAAAGRGRGGPRDRRRRRDGRTEALRAALERIEPFYVMECAKAAGEIARQPGRAATSR